MRHNVEASDKDKPRATWKVIKKAGAQKSQTTRRECGWFRRGAETHKVEHVEIDISIHGSPHVNIDTLDDQHDLTSSCQQVLGGYKWQMQGSNGLNSAQLGQARGSTQTIPSEHNRVKHPCSDGHAVIKAWGIAYIPMADSREGRTRLFGEKIHPRDDRHRRRRTTDTTQTTIRGNKGTEFTKQWAKSGRSKRMWPQEG